MALAILSHRLLADYDAVVEACCRAWNALTGETGRAKSLCAYPYLDGINAQARWYEVDLGRAAVHFTVERHKTGSKRILW